MQFTEQQKRCYEYSDGVSQTIYGDPLDIQERMRIFANGSPRKVVDAAFPDAEPFMISVPGKMDGDPVMVQKMESVPKMKLVQAKDDDGKDLFFQDGEPMMVWQPVLDDKGEPVMTERGVMIPMVPSFEEREAYYNMICAGFQVHRWDPVARTGMTKTMLQALEADFNKFMRETKKGPAASPTTSKPSEAASLPV